MAKRAMARTGYGSRVITPPGNVVLAFDKFRGTATAQELSAAGQRAAKRSGWNAESVPLADGGEGSLEAVGGANKVTRVTGPLGEPVDAGWRLDGQVAFIEMAAASGLLVAGGPKNNDAVAAATVGTGELIASAVELGARTVYVFLGGSATTDGGWGAIRALPSVSRLKEVELIVAADVRTPFVDAARVFAPQKGASTAQVALLERRLERLGQLYAEDYGVDVASVVGAGAAGGLAGGLMAVGGRIEAGFEAVAEWVALDEHLKSADLVVTGEGHLDAESFNGKVVGGVHEWASEQGVPVLAIVGESDDLPVPDGIDVLSLASLYGLDRTMGNPVSLVEEVLCERLSHWAR